MLCVYRLCAQDMVLFNDSIYYNIAYGNLSATREQVREGLPPNCVGQGCPILVMINQPFS